ncbi:MAG: chromate transporter [Acetobacteraceae bacterium]|nr:chromate transporter [Acetobacteraceae bacterium]
MAEQQKIADPVSLAALFAAFLQVSLFGFGGGLAWARYIVVEQRRWTSEEDFADIMSFCQFMPGPNMIGIAVCTGARLRGTAGTIAAMSGFLLVPGAIGFSLGMLYLRYTHIAVFRDILGGVSAAAAGLLIATGIRMLLPHRGRPIALFVAALTFGVMVFTNLPFLAVLFGMALVSLTVTQIEFSKAQ